MSTNFTNVNNGEVIEPVHVNRYIQPINNLESGDTWYREASNTGDAYKVSFASGNVVSSYTKGLMVHFKASADNGGAATLTITGPSGDLAAIDLVKKGGDPLDAGDISNGQVIAAIYTEDAGPSNPRFEVLGGLSSGGGLTSPVAIADGGTGATTAAGARTNLDVPSNSDLTSGLAGKANSSHTHAATDIGAGTVSDTEFGYLDGVTSAVQTQLDGKASSTHTHAASDITSGALGLARGGTAADLSATGGAGQVLKQSTSGGAVSVGALAAGDMPSGIDAAIIGAGSVSNTEFGYLDGVTSAVQTQLDGKASSTHTHPASDITSGTLGLARGGTAADLSATGGAGQVLKQSTSGGAVSVGALAAGDLPTGINAANIGAGSVSNTEFGYMDGVTSAVQTQLDGKASSTHTHAATDIGAGTVSNTEFGYLDGVTSAIQTQLDGKASSTHTHAASDITSGTLGLARGGTASDLSATGGAGQVLKQSTSGGAVSVGALAAGDMPSGIDAANIGAGSVSNTEFGYLDGVTSAIQTQLDGKASSTHTHAASDITSGALGLARGGTAADLSATGGAGQVLKQSTSGGAVSVGALAAGDMPTGIDAANIGAGSVSNTEFGYMDGVTSAVQTQLDGKQDLSEKGAADGYASLDGAAKVPNAQLAEVLALNDLSDVDFPTAPATGEVIRYDGAAFVNTALAISDVTDLQDELDAKQALSEKGAADGYASLDGAAKVPNAQLAEVLALSDLSNVDFPTTPATGEVIRYDGADFVNAALAISDITDLQDELDDKSDVGHTHPASDITSGQLGLARGGSGADLSATGGSGQVLKQTSIGGAVSVAALVASDLPTHNHAASDITSGQLGLARGGSGADLSATGGSGHVLKQTSTGGAVSVAALVAGDLPAHTHAASDITSGTLALARGGTGSNLSATGGSGQVLKQTSAGGAVSVAALVAGDLPTHTHAASDITSGTLALARGGTGSNLSATGGSGQVLKQTSAGGAVSVAALAAGDMPTGISAANISAGSVSNTEFDYLNGVTSAIQTQLNGKADDSHNHSAADITSGTLATARGGTGLSTFTGTGRVLYSSSSSALAALAAGSAGQVLTMSGGVPTWDDPIVSGSGTANRMAIWSSTSGLTSDSGITRSGSNLTAALLITSAGQINSTTSNMAFVTSGNVTRASFQNSGTFFYNIRNVAGGQLMYWNSTTNEATYQFSRGFHKEDVKKIDTSIEDLMKWRPVEFKWKEKFGGGHDVGLIAEEVAEVYPLAATYDQPWEYLDEKTGEYAINEDGTPKRLEGDPIVAGVKYEKAWIPMLAGVQDFYKRFQALESKLEARLAALEGAR